MGEYWTTRKLGTLMGFGRTRGHSDSLFGCLHSAAHRTVLNSNRSVNPAAEASRRKARRAIPALAVVRPASPWAETGDWPHP